MRKFLYFINILHGTEKRPGVCAITTIKINRVVYPLNTTLPKLSVNENYHFFAYFFFFFACACTKSHCLHFAIKNNKNKFH